MGTSDEERIALFNLPVQIEISLGQLAILEAHVRLGLRSEWSTGESARLARDFADTALGELTDRGFYSESDAEEIRVKEREWLSRQIVPHG